MTCGVYINLERAVAAFRAKAQEARVYVDGHSELYDRYQSHAEILGIVADVIDGVLTEACADVGVKR